MALNKHKNLYMHVTSDTLFSLNVFGELVPEIVYILPIKYIFMNRIEYNIVQHVYVVEENHLRTGFFFICFMNIAYPVYSQNLKIIFHRTFKTFHTNYIDSRVFFKTFK